MIATGDLNGEGKDDLIGVWTGIGTWVFHSEDGSWLKINDSAPIFMDAGKLR